MKIIQFLLVQLFFCEVLLGGNSISPIISEVTVYRNGAKVSNVASVTLTAGVSSDIVFENLSPYFNANSLQVKISGGSAKLLSAIFRQKNAGILKEPARAQTIRDSLLLLGDRLNDFRVEVEVLNEEALMLRENANLIGQSDAVRGRVVAVEDLKNMLAFYSKRALEIKNRNLEIERNTRKINELYQKLIEILRTLAPNAGNPTGEIVLKIDAPSGQLVEITVTYLVTQASWQPIYDLRTAGVDKPLNCIFRAAIQNNSGFDWKNVKLHLSSGQPLLNNERPILNPIWVEFRPVLVYLEKNGEKNNQYALQNMAQTPALAGRSSTDGGAVPARGSRDLATNYYIDGARISANGLPPMEDLAVDNSIDEGTLVNFDLEKAQDILANGQENIVLVSEQEMACEYEYHAVPKLDCAVFLLAKVPDYGKYNLLPGIANLFLEETFVGQASINPKITADTLLLSLGRDDQINIKRTQPQDWTSKKNGISGSSKKEINTFEITVKNNKRTAIRIEILDQIPVSRQGDIKVELEDDGRANYNPTFGKLSWKLEIAPNTNQKLRFTYSIKYPKDKPIQVVRD